MTAPNTDGCHCATCTCNPGMTPAIRFDTSPAAQEGAVRDHLIALGWTPPGSQHPAITHCDNCGCDWLDNGLNPIGCPYCKQPAAEGANVTHAAGCWSGGPEHYACAAAEIERLREQLRLATVDQAIAEAEASDAHAENKRLREVFGAVVRCKWCGWPR